MQELKPCPICGNTLPFTHISWSCVVLRCSCGIEFKNAAAQTAYKIEELPDELQKYAYNPTLLEVIGEDGKLRKFPDHGYICVSAPAALWYAGVTERWNDRRHYLERHNEIIRSK